MILYEYPFNERIRTYLRLEQLLHRLSQLMQADAHHEHHFALFTLFELMDVASRSDLKADVLKDLERQKGLVNSYRGNPEILEKALDQVVQQIDDSYADLNRQQGKAGAELLNNDWLMSVRSRFVIPGGTCSFDLPAYHAWQNKPTQDKKNDLRGWSATMVPMAQAIALLLRMLRGAGTPQRVLAVQGHYQQPLPQVRAFQLARVILDERLDVIPEISGNRLMISVRLMKSNSDFKFNPFKGDCAFELTLCSGV